MRELSAVTADGGVSGLSRLIWSCSLVVLTRKAAIFGCGVLDETVLTDLYRCPISSTIPCLCPAFAVPSACVHEALVLISLT